MTATPSPGLYIVRIKQRPRKIIAYKGQPFSRSVTKVLFSIRKFRLVVAFVTDIYESRGIIARPWESTKNFSYRLIDQKKEHLVTRARVGWPTFPRSISFPLSFQPVFRFSFIRACCSSLLFYPILPSSSFSPCSWKSSLNDRIRLHAYLRRTLLC